MEVILLESLDKLGKVGDVVIVKNGFARNFLFPQKKALRANKENKEYFLKIKNDLVEKNNKIIDEAKILVKKISTEEIIFIRNASDNGQLYGSVSPRDISNFFKEKKIEIKPSCINLHSAIKKIGIFEINIKLHADVVCKLKLNVATSMENAKIQKKESEQIKTKTDKLKQSISKDNEESKSSEVEESEEHKQQKLKSPADTEVKDLKKKDIKDSKSDENKMPSKENDSDDIIKSSEVKQAKSKSEEKNDDNKSS